MNLINEKVTHTAFGKGTIIDHTDSFITIDFDDDVKKFVYPDAFSKFIKLSDEELAKSLNEVLLVREKEEAALAEKREAEKEERALEQQRKDRIKNLKIHESSQMVFWLDEDEEEKVFNDWNVFVGYVQSGKNEGQPNKVARLSSNSANVLTVRSAEEEEIERRIVGLYMTTETFVGSLSEDGMIPAHEDFRIQLSEEEADKMLFWNYYINKSYPDRTAWNSGKYRYFDNVWTAQILKDIIALKTDEEEIKYVESFLKYFCQMNALDIDAIPEPNGALKQ